MFTLYMVYLSCQVKVKMSLKNGCSYVSAAKWDKPQLSVCLALMVHSSESWLGQLLTLYAHVCLCIAVVK